MKKRKAFTLSELLVVVVIIGVLSAVVLPKFSKVIETRKTTEAEELMTAVRTEQEARCTLSKNYTDKKNSLGSYRDGKNYDYELGTVGMTASAKSGKYTLEMPSYADGRICCSDIETGACNKLNKNYPLCSDLTNKSKTPDYVVGNEDCGVEICTGEDCYEPPTAEPENPIVTPPCPTSHTTVPTYTDAEGCTVTTNWELKEYPTCWVSTETKSNCPEKECTSGEEETKTCNMCGVKKRTCQSDGTWGEWGECSIADRLDCLEIIKVTCDEDLKPNTEQSCGCQGKQTRSVKCSPGLGDELPRWIAGDWGACKEPAGSSCEEVCAGVSVDKRECTPGETKHDGTNMCSYTTTTAPATRQEMFEAQEVVMNEPSVDMVDENTNKGSGKQDFYVVNIDYGWTCNKNCRWVKNSCPRRGGGGGGGGGHSDGGCGGFTGTKMYTNFDADSTYTWCTVSYSCGEVGNVSCI